MDKNLILATSFGFKLNSNLKQKQTFYNIVPFNFDRSK